MAKKVNVLPNERIDIPDFNQATSGFLDAALADRFDPTLLDRFARILNGFRVEIPDQGVSPGQLTIINGVGIRRDGDFLSNDEDFVASRSITLTGTATYYLEIELTSSPSDVDSRAFWDTTVDNGTDPSGDVRPPGGEFNQNVATRVTPDWTIVSPVATTDFEINGTTTANSNKVPLAIVEVVAGVITSATTASARTVLREDIAIAATVLRVQDARLLSGGLSITVGGEAATISASGVDRENGIITLTAGTAATHQAGDRVIVVGGTPTQYLTRRLTPKLPTSTGSTEDARPLMFQADEEVGFALAQNADAASGNADNQLKSLKDYVDFLAGQIREMKWGSARADTLGDVAPPTTFAATPRYFESAGGIAASRTNTISVGDGTTTFGDFNTTTSGSAQAAIQGAINSLPTGGGVIYIKGGTYDITTTALDVTESCVFIGDGRERTRIRATDAGGTTAINLAADDIHFQDMSFEVDTGGGATAVYAMTMTAAVTRASFTRMEIHGLTSGAFALTGALFQSCTIEAQTSGTEGFRGDVTNCTWRECAFSSLDAAGTGRAATFTGSDEIRLEKCTFAALAAHGAAITFTGTGNGVLFEQCVFSESGNGPTSFEFSAATTNRFRCVDCEFATTEGVGDFDDIDDIWFERCEISFNTNVAALTFSGFSERVNVHNCVLTQLTFAAPTAGRGIELDSASKLSIKGCKFVNCDVGIRFEVGAAFDFDISGCTFGALNAAVNRTRSGMDSVVGASFGSGTIRGCNFSIIQDSNVTTHAGINFVNAGGQVGILAISDCLFESIDEGTVGYGIALDMVNLVSSVKINNCTFDQIEGSTTTQAVRAFNVSDFSLTNCNFTNIGVLAGTTTAVKIFGGDENILVTNNMFNGVGSNAVTDMTAIDISDIADTAQMDNITVMGNHIRDVDASAVYRIVVVERAADKLIVSSNTIELNDALANGIVVQSSSAGGTPDIGYVIISNNIVRGVHATGIIAILEGPSSGIEGHCVITGNVIHNFATSGIFVRGNSTDGITNDFIISNNVLLSNSNTSGNTGILVNDVTHVVVSGNNVRIETPGIVFPLTGITILDNALGTVVGNLVHLDPENTVAGVCLNTDAFTECTVSGNFMVVDGGSGDCARVGNNTFTAGNYFRVNGGTGAALVQVGAGSLATAQSNADGVAADTAPTETANAGSADRGDIGLNKRRTV